MVDPFATVFPAIIALVSGTLSSFLGWMYSDPIWHFVLAETLMLTILVALLAGPMSMRKGGGDTA
jgi:hypothetical protein